MTVGEGDADEVGGGGKGSEVEPFATAGVQLGAALEVNDFHISHLLGQVDAVRSGVGVDEELRVES